MRQGHCYTSLTIGGPISHGPLRSQAGPAGRPRFRLVPRTSGVRTPKSTHHPHKIDNQHRACKTGGGAYFAFFLGCENSHTTPQKRPLDEEDFLWGWCVVGSPLWSLGVPRWEPFSLVLTSFELFCWALDGRKRPFQKRTRACRTTRFRNTRVSKWFLDLFY